MRQAQTIGMSSFLIKKFSHLTIFVTIHHNRVSRGLPLRNIENMDVFMSSTDGFIGFLRGNPLDAGPTE